MRDLLTLDIDAVEIHVHFGNPGLPAHGTIGEIRHRHLQFDATFAGFQDDFLAHHLRVGGRQRQPPPNEVTADAFAAHLLIPALGVREAFVKRGLNPKTASAAEIYAVACNFGDEIGSQR